MKKIIVIIISFVFLGACAQTTALIGPAITIGSTGNVMQAGFSYASNLAVKKKQQVKHPANMFPYMLKIKKKRKNLKKVKQK